MNNVLYNNIVIEASPELVPQVRIAPLNIPTMNLSSVGCDIPENFDEKWYVSLHKKARYAITVALEDLHLQKEDVVTILTTSSNYYVSGCVTRAIETVCQWNREIIDQTKAILVIHEFGYPYKELSELKKYGLPIIEDCAYAYFTKNNMIGQIGDYVIYSLTKSFNMQIGGVMLSKNQIDNKVSLNERDYILSHWSNGYKERNEIINKRLTNYAYLIAELKSLDIQPFFILEKGVVPGAFLFKWREDINYPDLKEYMQRNGVESSVFYTEKAFYIPLHQNLQKKELDYMINLLTYYYKTNVL